MLKAGVMLTKKVDYFKQQRYQHAILRAAATGQGSAGSRVQKSSVKKSGKVFGAKVKKQ